MCKRLILFTPTATMALLAAILSVATALASDLEITSFPGDGTLTWVCSNNGVTAYRVEWAPGVGGPWTNFTQAAVALDNIAPTGDTMTVRVPMFYRLLAVTNPPDMVLIPGGSNNGTNLLGTGESYDSGFYPQAYFLTVGSFYMDRTEVTKAKWDKVYGWATNHGYDFDHPGSGKDTNHPVQAVSWYDCVKWCNARSEMENRCPAYYTTTTMTTSTVYRSGNVDLEDSCVMWTTNGYRLPTDEEWEYAARGALVCHRFPWETNTISYVEANYWAANSTSYDLSTGGYHPAYFSDNPPYTSPAGAFEQGKNAYGLYDMAGNVWEWCWDWYPAYAGSYRVGKGGGWGRGADRCRVGYRGGVSPGAADGSGGFRTVVRPNQ